MIRLKKFLFYVRPKQLSILLALMFITVSVSAQQDIDILNQGIEFTQQEKYNEASLVFTMLIMKKDVSEKILQEAYTHRGLSFLNLKEYKRAEKDLLKAYSLNNQDLNTKHWLGDLYFQTGKMEQAVKWFDAALAQDQSNAIIYNSRGMAHQQLGKIALALSDYNSAIQYNPKLAAPYNNRGSATYYNQGLAKAHKLDIESAVKDFTTAINLHPYLCIAHKNRALAYSFLKKYELAMNDVKNAIACNEKAYDNWLAKAEIEVQMEQYNDTQASLLKALQLHPDSWAAHYKLSEAEMQLGNLDAAREHANQTAEILPPYKPAVDYRLAQIEALDGNLSMAIKHLKKAHKKGYFAERENFQNFLNDKAFEPYRKDPDFKKAFEKIRK